MILKQQADPKGIKKLALLANDQRHSKLQKVIFDTYSLKVPSFIYLCLLVETLRRIKVKALQNFEDFLYHQMNEFE